MKKHPKPPRSSTSKAAVAALALATGCAGAPARSSTRPPPQDCPQESLQAMRQLGFAPTRDPSTSYLLLPVTPPRWVPVSEGEVKMQIFESSPRRRIKIDGGIAHGTLYCHEGRAYIRITSFVLEGDKHYPVCFEMYEDINNGSPRGAPLRMDAAGNALILNGHHMGPVARFE